MTKPRVIETESGIQGEYNVTIYDQMQRRFRDKGWMETDAIIKSGLDSGEALELGPGPGYLGLEWLKKTTDTTLVGLDISADMIALANRNAGEYGLTDRVEYVESSGKKMPFEDDRFDAVFSNGSLHEWDDPQSTLAEMYRVLKPGGRLFISDLRRDINPLLKRFMWLMSKPKEIRPGFLTSVAAAYVVDEVQTLLKPTAFTDTCVSSNPMGLAIRGRK